MVTGCSMAAGCAMVAGCSGSMGQLRMMGNRIRIQTGFWVPGAHAPRISPQPRKLPGPSASVLLPLRVPNISTIFQGTLGTILRCLVFVFSEEIKLRVTFAHVASKRRGLVAVSAPGAPLHNTG